MGLTKRKKKKKRQIKKTHHAVVPIKAGVVSFENVTFLKIVHPVIADVLGEFLIRSVEEEEEEMGGKSQKLHLLQKLTAAYVNQPPHGRMAAQHPPPPMGCRPTHIRVLVVLLITTDFPLGSTLWSMPKYAATRCSSILW